jgi:hypothetical protein
MNEIILKEPEVEVESDIRPPEAQFRQPTAST